MLALLDYFIRSSVKYQVDESTYQKELLQLGISQEHVDTIVSHFKVSKDELSDYLKDQAMQISKISDTPDSVRLKISQILAHSEAVSSEKENLGLVANMKIKLDFPNR